MINSIMKYWLVIATAIVFASCSTDIAEEGTQSKDNIPVLKIGSVSVLNPDGTRAAKEGSSFVAGDTIGLYVLNDSVEMYSEYYDSCFNVPAVFDGTSWETNVNILLNHGDAYVFAYYPYKYGGFSFHDNGFEPYVVCNVYGEEGQPDAMFSSTIYKVTKDSSTVNMTFFHSTARLVFSIEAKDSVNPYHLTNVELTTNDNERLTYRIMYSILGDNITEATDSLNKDKIRGGSQYNDQYSLSLPCDKYLSNDTATDIEFFVPQQYNITEGLFTLTLTINDNNYAIPVPAAESWEIGKKYTYPVRIGTRE